MRKIFLWLIAICAVATFPFLFHSCKKNDTRPFSPVREQVLAWLHAPQSTGNPTDSAETDKLIRHLDFTRLRYEDLNGEKQFIVVPLKDGFQVSHFQNDKSINALVLKVLYSGTIDKGYIVQYIPSQDAGHATLPVNCLYNMYRSRSMDADGRFLFFNTDQTPAFSFTYKNGNLAAYSRIQSREKTGSVNKPPEDPIGPEPICTDWYWVTTTLYADGHTETTWEFAFTICESNGGGGNSPQDQQCCLPDGDMSVSSTFSPSDQNIICGIASTDPATGRLTKTCSVNWIFSKNRLLLWDWSYRSYESCKAELVGNAWKFVSGSINHTNVSQEGSIPPCVSFTCNVTASIGSTSTDLTQAAMDMSVTTTFNASSACCPFCQPKAENFNVRTFWYVPQ